MLNVQQREQVASASNHLQLLAAKTCIEIVGNYQISCCDKNRKKGLPIVSGRDDDVRYAATGGGEAGRGCEGAGEGDGAAGGAAAAAGRGAEQVEGGETVQVYAARPGG